MWANDKKRRDFLEVYKDWGLWFNTPELDLSYYRYLMPDGRIIIAMEHQHRAFIGYNKGHIWKTGVRYYIQKHGEPFTPESHSSISAVAELLKEAKVALQKGNGTTTVLE
jgi:hypothetical protein